MATTQQLLQEAEKAYHELMTGRSARVIVDGGTGERVEFTAARKADLYAYIQELRQKLAVSNGNSLVPDNGPAGFVF